MNYVVTGAQMKQIDRDTIERIGIPSMVLMERAALAVAEAAEERAAQAGGRRILAVCGTGNNGADGIAAGRILKGRGYDVTVLLTGDPEHATAEHRAQQAIAEQLEVPVVQADDFVFGDYDVILDALFGIGLSREIAGTCKELMVLLTEQYQKRGVRVVAVDIPSGIQADTGAVMGIALQADVTVTFGYRKTGLLLFPGRSCAGRLVVADIGFSDVSVKRSGWDGMVLGAEDRKVLPARQMDGNKGTFGKVLVIAGSRGMSGAAYLSALAACRTGAGLVKILTVSENREILQNLLPEAIVAVYDPETLAETAEFRTLLEEQCDWADAIVLGPGLGQESYVEYMVEAVLSHAYVPIVLDADGLNSVAAHPYLTQYFTENVIVTPHMGEMARLCATTVSELKQDPVHAAREYSGRYRVVCVLKDAATVIADKDGTLYVNASGCSAMAKGGSGDVLSGVIAGLLARGMEYTDAAAYGVYLHGVAGEAAAKEYGENGVLARDIANAIEGDQR
ncbi:MAG: NAD(P)H-hydrate dehydratase [Lachnospiraceae bacterium]|nr:NAD(P)H-hydrate dehydratase [Lachnospiraceae bacterium]